MREVKKKACEICGELISLSNYSKHIRRHSNHPDTFQPKKYALNHDGVVCQFCGKLCKNSNSLCNHERLCKANPDRQIISRHSITGRDAWNKGLSKETDSRVEKYSNTTSSLYKSGKIKGHIGDANPAKRAEVRSKISLTCTNKARNGQWHISLSKKMQYVYNDIVLDSKWELLYAIYLDEHCIMWERCKQRFRYTFEGKEHWYTPDFYLTDDDVFIEIKGYERPKDLAKWSQFPRDKKLVVLKEDDLRSLHII